MIDLGRRHGQAPYANRRLGGAGIRRGIRSRALKKHWIGVPTSSLLLWDLGDSDRVTRDTAPDPDKVTSHIGHNDDYTATFPSGRQPNYPVTLGGHPAMEGVVGGERMTAVITPIPDIGGSFTFFFVIEAGAYDDFDRLLSAGGVFDLVLRSENGRMNFLRTGAGGGSVGSGSAMISPSSAPSRGLFHYDATAETATFRTDTGSSTVACAVGSTPTPSEVKIWGMAATTANAMVGAVPVYGLAPGGLSSAERDAAWAAMGKRFGIAA